jgi:hypothetical protein
MDYVVAPFTVIVDSREQHPYSFTGFRADARQGRKPLMVPVEVAGLKTGDYSIKGYEGTIAIERKSKQDAYQTFCHEHDRFERELERLNALPGWAGIVVEASWASCIYDPPPHTKYLPKSFYRQVRAWQIRYRSVHWEFCDTRSWAERTVLRWLERYYRDQVEKQKQLAKEAG